MAARSVSIVLVNKTVNELRSYGYGLLHGIWRSSPPSPINPFGQAVWSSESAGTLTGTEGWASYHLVLLTSDVVSIPDPDDEHLAIRWDNPFSGSNSYAEAVGRPSYEVFHQGGEGDDATVTVTLRHASQSNWRWCKRCQCLAFAGNGPGRCVNGSVHDHSGSGNYTIVRSSPDAIGQAGWLWCNKCQCMAFEANPDGSCFAGGQHDHQGSGVYSLQNNIAVIPGQNNWRWCNKCQCLAFAGNATLGPCPSGGRARSPGKRGLYARAQLARVCAREVARLRGTSERTMANQIAAILDKLRVRSPRARSHWRAQTITTEGTPDAEAVSRTKVLLERCA